MPPRYKSITAANAPGSSASGKIVINYWNGFTGPDGKTMTGMVEQFEKANPDVEVRQQIIPWSTYYDKLTLSLAYGGAPDVFIIEAARFPQFAYYHTLRPLTDLLQRDPSPLNASDFAEVPWRESFYDGKLEGLPLGTFPQGLYYDTQLFKQAGIVNPQGNALPPANLTEFLADAKKLTRDTTGSGRIDQW